MEYYKKKLTGEERKKLGMTLFPPMDRLKLPDALRCERLREDVIKDIAADPKMFARFEKLEPEDQEMLLEFFMGNRGLNVLYDPFFKKIMNQERLEKFLEQVMGQPVKIVRIIPTGELQQSAEGSVMIMDMIVRLGDGSYVDLEVQRISVDFPFERAACYASDLVVRQYEQIKAEQGPGTKFNYQSIRPVYVIVIMNSGTEKYRAFPHSYIHRTPDIVRFDTGLEERAIQKYIFITLDIFRKLMNNEDKYKMTELEAWMTFFGSDRPEDIARLVRDYPEFKEMYREINRFRLKPEEMMGMIGDAIRILDEGDAIMQIERLHSEVEQLQGKAEQLQGEADRLQGETDRLQGETERLQGEKEQLQGETERLQGETERLQGETERLRDRLSKQDSLLSEKDTLIAELQKRLEQLQN